ncbi:hypothetical protein SDC9_03887 [bioreactor metagenome]|uniref:Uncharacterized protein n=1 Tax=bioreactor metagenome TaxID=1076179 RepID=A0A644SUP6_9ZZZZ|nr:hypothetical protein [Negativicutes bacterium]
MLLNRYAAAIAFSTALTFIVPVGVSASSFDTSTTSIRVGDVSYSRSETTADNIRFSHLLSSHYHRTIPASEVIRLNASFDFGFGDISMMYAAADYAGLPVDDIVILRRKNLGWGQIANMYGIKVKDLKRNHARFIDNAHVHGLDINYIDFDDDRDHGNYRDHDRDRDNDDRYDRDRNRDRDNNNRYEHDRDRDRDNDNRYERDRDNDKDKRYENDRRQGKNNDKHNENKSGKQNDKKDHNNGKGNGHK